MNLKDFKEAVLEFIEEHAPEATGYTNDIDIKDKINAVINTKMFEVSRYKKIEEKEEIEVSEDEEIEMSDIDSRCYQVMKIKGVAYELNGKYITFKEEGTASIYYYKYPRTITSDTDDDYKFEIDPEALEIMKIGVAADLLKTDVSNRFGEIWNNEYQRLLQTLDSRRTSGIITIGEGVNI